MNKKKIIVPLIALLLAAAVYIVFFHKDKRLYFIPENADAVVLIDVKKLTGQYLFSLVTHPSQWSGKNSKGKSSASLKDSGIKIPDFLQIFHVRGTRFSQWYTVLELQDKQKFISYLKNQNFTDNGKNHFQKDQIVLILDDKYCFWGTSEISFESIKKDLFGQRKKTMNADQFIDGSLGSISFISGEKILNFSVELTHDEIEIKNNSNTGTFNNIASKLQDSSHFLEVELDQLNIRNITRFFNKDIADSSQAVSFKATADLEQVNDTIISYEYDDNFNEVEKKTFQKITQPNYIVDIQSKNTGEAWEYFQSKNWINGENQFTAIPFQPNKISQNNNSIIIKSIRKPVKLSSQLKENYILMRNNPLLYSSLKMLTNTEKRMISDIDYILYANNSQDYWVKIKAKKGDLPLILRW
ncbi:hypothetical protein F3J23_09575 [Chryseobacterium sp. Tr-659]|uniref:hypothetical protein n=1 Tax=Chryseobacterium sp. Tr-659 TaxID=2608340 RepID=UPI00142300A5|nr:hypothetical protein [Chryseobacterium sp. Tr-659]NIF05694.1 hypothetical protein [Chryseobacterium sp. Tr-659]